MEDVHLRIKTENDSGLFRYDFYDAGVLLNSDRNFDWESLFYYSNDQTKHFNIALMKTSAFSGKTNG
jgi:hypothetical protein